MSINEVQAYFTTTHAFVHIALLQFLDRLIEEIYRFKVRVTGYVTINTIYESLSIFKNYYFKLIINNLFSLRAGIVLTIEFQRD